MVAIDTKADSLRSKLYEVGICPDCFDERQHAVSEPFSTCSCGTSEDTEGPGLIQLLRTENAKLRSELAAVQTRHTELVRQIRGVGARIPCNTGGTFENDPPDAIVDACWRECRDVKAELAATREDTERLDWADKHLGDYQLKDGSFPFPDHPKPVRAAIDAVRKGQT